ncbi:hypothetical protein HETIRDRAFT_413428 [Heterobasidion irregulare TC 32-1]|uniref:Uncharacterized protein n=1 Tax=Heterobasidion irregulare (strain TC 32-1) TaxID=747525 RepID=W4KN00_HETIT|nr:uncharacterized protein HETIRDRAFT_413428 [Heterobasidion irregulare TC 32-1]ETW87084.1 hypothetical protein HETIRDRAFT_413428 [Heterobasidion irregulare TC 32-1]
MNKEFLKDNAPNLRYEIESDDPGYRLARVVTDGCHTNRPSAGDAKLHPATHCQLVVMFLESTIEIDWSVLEPVGNKACFPHENEACPYFDALVSECKRGGSPHGIITDEHHIAILYFPPNGPPFPYDELDFDVNFFILNSFVIDSPIRWTIASCVHFAANGSIKPPHRSDSCQGALRVPLLWRMASQRNPKLFSPTALIGTLTCTLYSDLRLLGISSSAGEYGLDDKHLTHKHGLSVDPFCTSTSTDLHANIISGGLRFRIHVLLKRLSTL